MNTKISLSKKKFKRCSLILFYSFLFFFILFSTSIYSQRTVEGTVRDESGPLPGVSVIVEGTSTGVVTDFDGKYTINVPENGRNLVFSYLGFVTQKSYINGDVIDITLAENPDELDEVVITGYGAQRKETVTGAVAAIKGEKIVKSPAVDLSNSLSGRLPGLIVIQRSGEPGSDAATINIRGLNTLGNSSPLVVIDGIPDRDGGIGRLNPQDIEDISVLKDASSAIYGARAANGVILITTKRGATGAPLLEYSFNAGFSTPTVFPNMSNAHEYASIMNEVPIYKTIPVSEWGSAWDAIKSTGSYDSPTPDIANLNANYSPEALEGFRTGNDPWKYPDTDWYRETFKENAPQHRHNLQLSGGSEKVKYFASLGYVFQDAIYKKSANYYNQYNLRLNLNAEVNDYISMNFGVMTRREERNYTTVGSGAIFRMLQRGRPVEPAFWPTGEPGPDIENGQNPVVVTTGASGYVQIPRDYIQVNGGVNIKNPWIEGLELIFNGSVDVNRGNQKRWETPWKLYSWDKKNKDSSGLSGAVRSPFTDPRLTETSYSVLNTTFTTQLKYNFTIGEDHDLSFFAGVTGEVFSGSAFFAFRRNYISPAIDQLFAGGTEDQNTGGSAFNRSRLGYYGRIQYNYNDTYLAELLFRRDGSYMFPEQGRYGNFPGFLLGWNITNESWFDFDAVNFLKVRASYGEMGNDQVFYNNKLQEYAYLSTFGFGEYPINNAVQKTLYETVLPNPNFTWEVAKNTNIGIDASVFDRFNLTLEWFNNQRDKILIQQQGSTPESSGISSLLPPVNLGRMSNTGFEFSLSYKGGDFNYTDPAAFRFTAGFNGGYAKNKIEFIDEVSGVPDYQKREGKPLGAPLLYQYDGVFFDQNEIDAETLDYSAVSSKLLPGDMKFKDIDGNGKINADDAVRSDKSFTPTIQYGIIFDAEYRNFDLSILFQGSSGGIATIRVGEFGDIGNYYKWQHDNRWSIDNPSSVHPRLASRNDTYYTSNYGNNTYYFVPTNYLRLKNIELGYTVPQHIIGGDFISKVRVYANGLNILTFAEHDEIFDPEVAGRGYPLSRVINLGLRVSF